MKRIPLCKIVISYAGLAKPPHDDAELIRWARAEATRLRGQMVDTWDTHIDDSAWCVVFTKY